MQSIDPTIHEVLDQVLGDACPYLEQTSGHIPSFVTLCRTESDLATVRWMNAQGAEFYEALAGFTFGLAADAAIFFACGSYPSLGTHVHHSPKIPHDSVEIMIAGFVGSDGDTFQRCLAFSRGDQGRIQRNAAKTRALNQFLILDDTGE